MSRLEIQRSLFGRTRKQRDLESPIRKAVIEFLNLIQGCRVWRQNVGGSVYRGKNGERYFVKFGEKGMCDISGIIRGLRIEVETKAEGEEPEVWQHAWMDFIRSHGGIAFWCDSLEMCQMKLQVEFQRRGWKW